MHNLGHVDSAMKEYRLAEVNVNFSFKIELDVEYRIK